MAVSDSICTVSEPKGYVCEQHESYHGDRKDYRKQINLTVISHSLGWFVNIILSCSYQVIETCLKELSPWKVPKKKTEKFGQFTKK